MKKGPKISWRCHMTLSGPGGLDSWKKWQNISRHCHFNWVVFCSDWLVLNHSSPLEGNSSVKKSILVNCNYLSNIYVNKGGKLRDSIGKVIFHDIFNATDADSQDLFWRPYCGIGTMIVKELKIETYKMFIILILHCIQKVWCIFSTQTAYLWIRTVKLREKTV